MTTLRIWFLGIFAAALLLNILCSFVSKGTFGTICSLLAGLTMMLVMIKPLLNCEIRDIFSQYSTTEDVLQETIDDYQEKIIEQESAIIQEQSAAYIAKKASTMNVTCAAVVQCETIEGTPFPVSVSLNIPYHSELSAMISEDLAIPRENQFWQGEQS